MKPIFLCLAILPLSAMGAIFEIASDDGDYSFSVGGRIQLDYNRYDGVINKSEFDTDEEWFLRRVRSELSGKIKDFTWYYATNHLDSTEDNMDEDSLEEASLTYNGWGKKLLVTVGQQGENFGHDDTVSSKWITAIEISMPANAFSNSNNRSVKVHGSTDFYTYNLSYVFDENIDQPNDALDHAWTGRYVVRPIMTEDRMLHLGASYTRRDGDFSGFGARLGIRGGHLKLANSVSARYKNGIADEMETWAVEAAASLGPVHMIAEYFDGELDGKDANSNIDADGYYLMAGWIITGESRTYKTSNATFEKVKPSREWGAVEVFARYDDLDVSDNDHDPLIEVMASEGETWTMGVNWYYNTHLRLSLNYVHAEVDHDIDTKDDGDALTGRVQLVF